MEYRLNRWRSFGLLLETVQDEGETQPPMTQQLAVQTSLAFAG